MKQKKQIYYRFKCLSIKELFVHFSCTVFGIHFSPFLSEKSFSPVEVKCLRKIFTFQLGNLSIEKVKAFCLEYCNDDR